MPRYLKDKAEIVKTFRELRVDVMNRETYRKLQAENPEIINFKRHTLPAGFEFIRVDGRLHSNEFELALVNTVVDEIIYYNQVQVNPEVTLNTKPATQVRVWRGRKPEYTSVVQGIARLVFLDYLLPKYNVLVSDNNQTYDGADFWESRIYDALSDDLYVYYYKQMDGTLQRLANRDEFQSLLDEIWSDKEDAQYRLMVISCEELPSLQPKITF